MQEVGVYTEQKVGMYTEQEVGVYTEQEVGVHTEQWLFDLPAVSIGSLSVSGRRKGDSSLQLPDTGAVEGKMGNVEWKLEMRNGNREWEMGPAE